MSIPIPLAAIPQDKALANNLRLLTEFTASDIAIDIDIDINALISRYLVDYVLRNDNNIGGVPESQLS